MTTSSYVFEGPAVRVDQPIGSFVLASIPWSVLREITYPDELRLATDPIIDPKWEEWRAARRLEGTQRQIEANRLKEIGRFIRTFDATFPNAIILCVPDAADVEGEPGAGADWQVVPDEKVAQFVTLRVPRGARLAVVVDGQHRLYAFGHAQLPAEQKFDLVCSIFFGLPQSMQAMVFATINANQKPVRRGLAMNLYGYNLEDEDPAYWSPEKLAVFMTRRLNFDEKSPVHRSVKVEAAGAPEVDLLPGAARPMTMVSVVDGVLGLISKKPKADRDTLRVPDRLLARRVKRRELPNDRSPLREWYLQGRDADLYALLVMFFAAVCDLFSKQAGDASMLTRSIGIRALFRLLGRGVGIVRAKRTDPALWLDAIGAEWRRVTGVASQLSFTDPYYEANDKGRRRIELVIALAAGLTTADELPESERDEILRRVATART